MTTPSTYWLSCHVGYACRHSGACCSAGWPIPLESAGASRIGDAARAGTLALPAHWLDRGASAPEGIAGVLALGSDRHCVFHRAASCEIQSALGHEAIPSACQHFPRVCLIDDRGVFVTLSHFCPTAASLLFAHEGPVEIVEGPPALPGGAVPEGLDARGALPPMRTPSRLFSLDEYSAFESHMVTVLTTVRPSDALERLRADTEVTGPAREVRDLFRAVCETVPAPWTWPAPPATAEPIPPRFDGVVGRFLAAHAFASWAAYASEHVRAVIGGIEAARAVLTVESARGSLDAGRAVDEDILREAIRRTDLLLVHYADRERLAGIH